MNIMQSFDMQISDISNEGIIYWLDQWTKEFNLDQQDRLNLAGYLDKAKDMVIGCLPQNLIYYLNNQEYWDKPYPKDSLFTETCNAYYIQFPGGDKFDCYSIGAIPLGHIKKEVQAMYEGWETLGMTSHGDFEGVWEGEDFPVGYFVPMTVISYIVDEFPDFSSMMGLTNFTYRKHL